MGLTDISGELSPAAQARAREGVEHLQTAARELIAAARAALDVAEEVVNDPESIATLAGTLASVGEVARRVGGLAGQATSPGWETPVDDEPRVQRIRVT